MEKVIGAVIMFGSIIFYGALAPLLKRANQDLQPFTLMAITMFFLFLIAGVASVVFEQSLTIKHSLIRTHLPTMIIFSVVNFFAFWLFILGYKYFAVWQQQLFYLLMPIFGGIIAYFLLGEAISIKLFIGLAIISLGIYIGLR
ncbi:MAG TPA: EamA family transporter [Patescibacteria group bacterium]|nr:EamA family transporter [Patescibacteria group bacterium]